MMLMPLLSTVLTPLTPLLWAVLLPLLSVSVLLLLLLLMPLLLLVLMLVAVAMAPARPPVGTSDGSGQPPPPAAAASLGAAASLAAFCGDPPTCRRARAAFLALSCTFLRYLALMVRGAWLRGRGVVTRAWWLPAPRPSVAYRAPLPGSEIEDRRLSPLRRCSRKICTYY